MNQIQIGKFIKKLRCQKGLTQTELGNMLGVSYKAVSKWERGINMPDVSLFKPLCDILGIEISELMNGDYIEKENIMKKKIFILIFLLLILASIVLILIFNKKVDTDYKIEFTKNSDALKVVNDYGDYKLWYLNSNNVTISYKGVKYDFIKSLDNVINIDEFKNYLLNSNLGKLFLNDGGTTIFIDKDYSIIMCKTLEHNNDIYMGPSNMHETLKDNFCGHVFKNDCKFTRTYHVEAIYPYDNEYYINATLKEFQGDIKTVKIPISSHIESGKTYEFTFITYNSFIDNIVNIFENSILISVEETNKEGLEQVFDEICISKVR